MCPVRNVTYVPGRSLKEIRALERPFGAERLLTRDLAEKCKHNVSSLAQAWCGSSVLRRACGRLVAPRAAVGRRCASCHTDSYAGTKAVARLAGQREEYLVKALHDYKSGVRAGGAGAAMTDVAYPLSDEEITALAHYLAQL